MFDRLVVRSSFEAICRGERYRFAMVVLVECIRTSWMYEGGGGGGGESRAES